MTAWELPVVDETSRTVRGVALLAGQLRVALRVRGYSRHTEKAYVAWLRRFAAFCGGRHPLDAERTMILAFLSRLSRDRAGPSTQNQAASALAFLLREVLGRAPGELSAFIRPRLPRRAPAVLSSLEVRALLDHLRHPIRLIVALLYGSGLRLSECCRLEVQDVDFESGQLVVREGKGGKDRRTLLPSSLATELREHIESVRLAHEADAANGIASAEAATTPVPDAAGNVVSGRAQPLPGARHHWLFPGRRLHAEPRSQVLRRTHIHPNVVQREVTIAARAAHLDKHVTCHALRHSFATELLRQGENVRTIQELLGHRDVATTLIYARRPKGTVGPDLRSPMDEGGEPAPGADQPTTRDGRDGSDRQAIPHGARCSNSQTTRSNRNRR